RAATPLARPRSTPREAVPTCPPRRPQLPRPRWRRAVRFSPGLREGPAEHDQALRESAEPQPFVEPQRSLVADVRVDEGIHTAVGTHPLEPVEDERCAPALS